MYDDSSEATDQVVGGTLMSVSIEAHATGKKALRDSRKSTALACSTASPKRPIGRCVMRRFNFSGVFKKSMRSGVLSGPLKQPGTSV